MKSGGNREEGEGNRVVFVIVVVRVVKGGSWKIRCSINSGK
jgi:hypothetical protein